MLHQSVLGGLVDPHVHPERNRFIGQDCLEANLLDGLDLEVHEIHFIRTYGTVLLIEDVMLIKGPVGSMEKTVVIGKLETDRFLEKALRGVFLPSSEPILFNAILCFSRYIPFFLFLVAPLEFGWGLSEVKGKESINVLHGSLLDPS